MLRAALFALLTVSILGSFLQGQQAIATFHVSGATRMPVSAGSGFQRGLPNRFLPIRSHLHHDRLDTVFVPYFLPYDEPSGYDQAEPKAALPEAVLLQPDAQPSRMTEHPVLKAKVIEVPRAANATAGKPVLPTIFMLANGERLESRRYVITASSLYVCIGRQQRTVPIELLDVDATIAVNRERGVDVRIPADPNEISLSF